MPNQFTCREERGVVWLGGGDIQLALLEDLPAGLLQRHMLTIKAQQCNSLMISSHRAMKEVLEHHIILNLSNALSLLFFLTVILTIILYVFFICFTILFLIQVIVLSIVYQPCNY
jgi:hypothetical protein